VENEKKKLLKTSLKNFLYANMLALLLLLLISIYQYFVYDISFNRILENHIAMLIQLNLTFGLIFAVVWGDKINQRQGLLFSLPIIVAILCVIYIYDS